MYNGVMTNQLSIQLWRRASREASIKPILAIKPALFVMIAETVLFSVLFMKPNTMAYSYWLFFNIQ